MTTTSAIQRQPTKFDYASPTQFKFSILKLPKVEYFCTAVNIPGVELGTAEQATPLKVIPTPGTVLTYGDLEMSFLVDENLENYREIHGWLTGLGFPKDRSQFRALLASGADRFPTSSGTNQETDAGKVKHGAGNVGAIYSDATLNILTSKNRSNIEVRFSDVFPVRLTGLDYDQQATDVSYLTASVTFNYKIFEFALKSASRATETSS